MININNHDQRCHLEGKEALKVVAMGREDWRQAIRRASLSSSSPSSSPSSSSSSLLTTSGGHRAGARRQQWAKAADGTRPHGHPCRLLLDPRPHIFLVNIVSIIVFIGIAFMVSCRFLYNFGELHHHRFGAFLMVTHHLPIFGRADKSGQIPN